MRYSPEDKLRIIRQVAASKQPKRITLKRLDISSSTYYKWYRRYRAKGIAGLENRKTTPNRFWNRLSDREREQVLKLAISNPAKTPRDIARDFANIYGTFIAPSSVYRLLNDYDHIDLSRITTIEGHQRSRLAPQFVNDIWSTAFVFIKLPGWGFYYLLAILDDYSKYIINHRLLMMLSKDDVVTLVTETLDRIGLDHIRLKHRARLLTGNATSNFIDRLRHFLIDSDKTERAISATISAGRNFGNVNQSKGNIINLLHYYLPSDLEIEIDRFIDCYNNEWCIRSRTNLTPAAVYFGEEQSLQRERQMIKEKTLMMRKIRNLGLEQ